MLIVSLMDIIERYARGLTILANNQIHSIHYTLYMGRDDGIPHSNLKALGDRSKLTKKNVFRRIDCNENIFCKFRYYVN